MDSLHQALHYVLDRPDIDINFSRKKIRNFQLSITTKNVLHETKNLRPLRKFYSTVRLNEIDIFELPFRIFLLYLLIKVKNRSPFSNEKYKLFLHQL